jgi:hypothetical protein
MQRQNNPFSQNHHSSRAAAENLPGTGISRQPPPSGVTQLKPAVWNLTIIVKGPGGAQRKAVDVDYDDEKHLPVSTIKEQLQHYNGGIYKVTMQFIGSNSQMDSDLKNDAYGIPGNYIKLNGGKILALLEPMQSELELEQKAHEQQPRPGNVIKKRELQSIVEQYGFAKIVTGNHINSAKEYASKETNDGVVTQQIKEVHGNTLFIDPLFQAPGAESQYHDILLNDGATYTTNAGLGLYIIHGKSFTLGILCKGVYTDEVTQLGVPVSEYISVTRPADVIGE